MSDYTQQGPDYPQNNAPIRQASESKDFRYYYSILLNKWYWLAMGLVVGLSLFYVNIRYAKNHYKVSGSVLIEDTEKQSLSKEVISQEFGFDKGTSNMEDRIRLLGSTELMQRVVDSLDLNVAYVEEGRVKTNELFDNSPVKLKYWNTEGSPKNFTIRILNHDSTHFTLLKSEKETEILKYGVPFTVDRHALVLKKIAPLSDQYPMTIAVRDDNEIAGLFSSRLEIGQAGRSNILNISIIDEIPERGIAIINRLVREYSIASMETKNDAGRRTLSFIDERLNYVTKELYNVEQNVQTFKQDRSLPILIPQMAQNYIDKTNVVEAKIIELDNRLNFVKNVESIMAATANGQYKTLPYSTEISTNAPLLELIKRYNDLLSKRTLMLESAKEGNPILASGEEELKTLKNNIITSIQTIKQEVNDQKELYRQQIIPLENQINAMPQNDRELTQIMREQGIKQTLFLFLLQKREETALTVAAQVAHSRLLEKAANRGIVSPKPVQMVLFYIFVGLGIPIFFLYLKDLFNDKIYHRSDIDKFLNLPFVGFIPHVGTRGNRLIINDSHSVLAESFRLVRSNLQNTAPLTKSRTILVTSTVSGDGKSFVTINLALTMALTGKRVIAVGLDLRKPKLEMYLEGEKSEKGLSHFLNGTDSLKDLIQVYDKLPNLHFIDCGTIPRNPSELMMTDKIDELFTYLSTNYDFILVDGAPIGIVADSFLLKDYIQQTLIVLRYGSSTNAHLKFLSEVHTENKLPNLNVLMNDLRQERGNSYNYGYYSSSYYQEKPSWWERFKGRFMKKKQKKSAPKRTLATASKQQPKELTTMERSKK
jgi:tyrosine-protein kinase Etk/Wzc